MTLDPSKFYRTRDGRKARIYTVYGDNSESSYTIHGAVFILNTWWSPYSWTKYGYTAIAQERPTDLVSEWVEPEPKPARRIAWINKGAHHLGGIYLTYEDEELDINQWGRAPWLDEPEQK